MIMKDIFDSCEFGDFKLKSRIVRTGLWESQNRKHGDLKPEVFLRYDRLSNNHVGLIISELISLYPHDRFSDYSHKIDYPLFMKDFKLLTDTCHENDTVIFAQIAFSDCNVNGRQNIDVNDLTLEDIRQIQGDYLVSARKISFAGFDGIQLNIGNNYYLSKVVDGRENRRKDNYGGSVFNRLRMVLEIVQAIKKTTTLHVNCRINIDPADEDESLEMAKLLEKYGADSLQVTKSFSPKYFVRDSDNKGELYDLTDKLAGELEIPVILAGGLSNKDDINDLINNTNIEFVSMQRPFVYNPTFLDEWKNNQSNESGCVTCNNCYLKKTSTCHIVGE